VIDHVHICSDSRQGVYDYGQPDHKMVIVCSLLGTTFGVKTPKKREPPYKYPGMNAGAIDGRTINRFHNRNPVFVNKPAAI
jgi:hypothetical protein